MTQPAASRTLPLDGERLVGRLREIIAGAKSGNPLQRVTVVTPSYYSSFYLRRSLAANGLINVEFMRIEDLADHLAQSRKDAHDGRSLTRLEGTELVRQAVTECVASGDLSGPLSELTGQPSFLAALQRSLSEIEAEQGDSPVSFDQLSEPGEVTLAVGNIWNVYQRLKQEQNLFDRTQVSAWAVETLQSGVLETPEAQLAIGKLVVLAVATPASQYLALWKTLTTQQGSAVLVGTTGDERSDALLSNALDFTFETTTPDEIPVPEAVSALDARSEIAGLVQRIAAEAATGIRFNRIAVLYGNPSYASRIRSALELARIPVSGPPQEPLIASSTGRFVSGILQIATTDFARQNVGDWLATCPVQHPVSGQPVRGVEWDRISKTARVTGGVESWKHQLGHFASSRRFRAAQIERHGDDSASDESETQAAESLSNEANQATDLSELVGLLAVDLESPGEAASWGAWADWLSQIVDRYLHAPEKSATTDSADRVRTLLTRIRDLDHLGSSQPDLNRFTAIVIRELSDTRAGANNLGKGVFVASIQDAVATDFSHVHVVGMTDGTFPSPDTADPLLPDHVRNELNNRFGTALRLSGVRKDQRRRQFLTALMSGENATLYWSRSSGPGSGEAGPAQWLIEQVRKREGNESLQAGDLLKQPEKISGVSIAEYARGSTFSDSHEYEVASVRRHVEQQPAGNAHWLENDPDSGVPAALLLEGGRYGKSFTAWSGDLSSSATAVPAIGSKPLSESSEVLSASRIESFATCPLRYLFRYVLKVDPGVREDDSFHMAPDRRGTFIHAVLETYLKLRIADNRPQGGETLDKAMSEVVEDWQRKEPGASGRVWQLETTEIRRQLRRWLEAEKTLESAGSTPSDAELSFGRRSATPSEQLLPPFEITLEDSTVLQFAGVIDRVQRRSDGSFYVLDYKTGGPGSYTKLKEDPVDRGRHLQLALYSKAVQQFRSPAGETDAGYWFVADRRQRIIPGPDEFDPAFAEKRLRNVLESLKGTSEDGHFPPNPGGRRRDSFENCGYCEFNRVCPANSRRERMLQAHSNDPRLAQYFDLALGEERGAE